MTATETKVKIGDIVLIEILKKEKLATVIYVDVYNQRIGTKLIDPIVNGFSISNITTSKNEHGLMLSIYRIKKILNGTDILNRLISYKHQIQNAQRIQSHLKLLLSNKHNHKNQCITNINKECIIKTKGLNIKFIDDQKDKDNKPKLNDYELIKTLGIGAFGRVKLAENKLNGKCFAMKIISKSKIIETKQKSQMLWENKLLSEMINHSYIVKLINNFENEKYLYWLLELVNGGDLFSLIRNKKRLSLKATKFFSAQIVYTFKYLHCEKSIIFRDLKPENVLIDKFGYIKLGDFGIAKHISNCNKMTYTLCGTPEYLAPELLIGKGYSFGIDWYALGILCYEMLFGQTPFISDKTINIYNQILSEKVNFKKINNIKINNGAKQFIHQLLIKNPNKRLKDPNNIIKHQFYNTINWKQIANKTVDKIPFVPNIINDKDTRYFDLYDDDESDQEQHEDD